jgi:hypothetical protein
LIGGRIAMKLVNMQYMILVMMRIQWRGQFGSEHEGWSEEKKTGCARGVKRPKCLSSRLRIDMSKRESHGDQGKVVEATVTAYVTLDDGADGAKNNYSAHTR